MKRYWLDQRGQTTGPFAERVLMEMWDHGQIDATAQVCEEGMEDWMPARFVVGEIEMARERGAQVVVHTQKGAENRQKEARKLYRKKARSRAVAFLLDFMVPGLGHAYCGELITGVGMFILAVGGAVLVIAAGVPVLLGTISLLSGLTGLVQAGRRNRQLADELDL